MIMKQSVHSFLIFILLLLLIHGVSRGQGNSQRDKSLIQFSGVVVSADSLQPIPFTNVIIRNARRGTITDFYGFFSFVAMKGDTLDFQYVGFKTNSFIIPDSLIEQHYSIIQVLVRDTINLKEAVVYPWPTKDEFKRAFIELKLSDDDLKRAQRNFELAAMKEIQAQVIYDGGLNYQMAVQQRQTQLYSQGQFRSISLLNPLAWAAFIQSWKDGAYKKKEKK